jgi:hypothetical protein
MQHGFDLQPLAIDPAPEPLRLQHLHSLATMGAESNVRRTGKSIKAMELAVSRKGWLSEPKSVHRNMRTGRAFGKRDGGMCGVEEEQAARKRYAKREAEPGVATS